MRDDKDRYAHLKHITPLKPPPMRSGKTLYTTGLSSVPCSPDPPRGISTSLGVQPGANRTSHNAGSGVVRQSSCKPDAPTWFH